MIGAATGVIAGLLGVGGGIVLVPCFFYLFGQLGYASDHLMQVCIRTSTATIVVTSLRSVALHSKKGAVDWALLKGWAPWLVLGSILGVVAAYALKNTALQAIFGGLAHAGGALHGLRAARVAAGRRDAAPAGCRDRGHGAGLFSTLMGIGGGTFGVPLMTLYGKPIHRAVATASGFGVAILDPSLAGFLFLSVPDAPPFSIRSGQPCPPS